MYLMEVYQYKTQFKKYIWDGGRQSAPFTQGHPKPSDSHIVYLWFSRRMACIVRDVCDPRIFGMVQNVHQLSQPSEILIYA